jgi:hypothetical protein
MSNVVRKLPFSRIFVFLLVGAVVFRVAAAFFTAGDTELTVWGDRDLWRALTVGSSWPISGPEINGGLRPPGGAFYLLLAGVLAFQPSVWAANIGVLALFAASLLLLGFVVAREATPRTGAVAAAAMAGAPMLGQVLKVWNPGFLLFFATAATLFGYRYLKTGKRLPLGLAALATAIGLQIHLQIFQLAIALLIAGLILRPRWTWRHAVVLIIGLSLPYLPSVIGGHVDLLTSTLAVPAGAVDNYVLWGFPLLEKAQLFYGVLGGTPDLDPSGLASLGRIGGLTLLAMAADLLVALLVLGLLGWTIRRHQSPGSRLSPGIFALIAAVYLGIGAVSSVNARHMVAAWPAIAILTAIATDAVLGHLAARSNSRLSAVGGVVLLCGLAVRPVLLGEAALKADDGPPSSAMAQSEIATVAKSIFFAGHDAFEAHTALFWRPQNRPWQLAQEGVEGQMTFVFQTTPAPPVETDREECLAILSKENLTADAGAELAKSPVFGGLAPVFGPKTAESAHFVYFPYKTVDGNCLKSFPNAYIPSAFEDTFLQPGRAPAVAEASSAVQFITSLPGQIFPIGLELRHDEARYHAVLHSRLLRGYTGLSFTTIVNPTLCLEANGDVRLLSFRQTTVGSPQRGTLAPWRSPSFAVPDGTFRLWLIGLDGKSSRVIQAPLGRVTLPDMRAAPPTADDMTPPAGCPIPGLPRPQGAG